MAKEFFDQAAVTMTDSHKFGVGLGESNAMKTITYAALKALLTAISWTFSGNITFSNNIVMSSKKITGLTAGSAATDSVTKGQMDTADGLRLALAGGTMAGAIAMGMNKITGVGNGVDPQDAVTKNQLDTKQDSISANDTEFIYDNAGTKVGTDVLKKTANDSVTVKGTSEKSAIIATRGFMNITESFTPTDTTDAKGLVGDFTWDDDYFYVKTNNGWGRLVLDYGF